MQRQPTLLSACARAATAAEARFRIDYPDTIPRTSRVIALDGQAAALVRRLAGQPWRGGHFLVFDRLVWANGSHGERADAALRDVGGAEVLLSAELDGADVAVMVATEDARLEAASIIGGACAMRGIMSAGLVIDESGQVGEVVAAFRPHAMVLVILRNISDVPEILSALRV